MSRSALALAVVSVLAAAGEAAEPVSGPTRDEIESLLRTAEIVELEPFDSKGVTRPLRATLDDGDRILRAVFKNVDVVLTRSVTEHGRLFYNIRDSYRHEIAAYELDKLLGFDLVPPTVERHIGSEIGSLQLWIDGAITEWERKYERQLTPPDIAAWNRQIAAARLFVQLTWDTDYTNVANLLVDLTDWKIWKIDSSRAFHIDRRLRKPSALTRFPQRTLDALRGLDRNSLEETLSPWLDRREIRTLWRRCQSVVELADRRIAERGEAAVVFD